MTTTFQLIARSGPTAGNTYSLEQEEIFVGRDLNNDIVINDPEVSRRHIRFYRQGGTYVLEDLGSTNGTLVNGQRVTGTYNLNTGEEITLGEHVHLEFERIGGGHTDETLLSSRAVEADKTFMSVSSQEAEKEWDLDLEKKPEAPVEPELPLAYAGQVPAQPQRVKAQPEKQKKLPGWVIAIAIILLILICACSITAFFMPAEWWCAIDIFGIFQGCPR